MYQISGGKERGKIQAQTSFEKFPELFDDKFSVVAKLSEAWNNRLVFSAPELPKRYMGRYLAIHLHGLLILNERPRAFCLLVIHERPECLGSELPAQNRKDNYEFPMLVESVHIVDDEKGTVLRVRSNVWLKLLDECLRVNVRDSLYFSLISGKFVFANRRPVQHGKLDSIGMVNPVGIAGQLPDQVVITRPEMMDDLSCQNAKPEWDRSAQMIIGDYLKHLVILVWNDGVLALLEKGIDLPIEMTDTLIGPFDLLLDPL